MGVQPIDLQNMYSQLSNVAKTVAGQQQAAQLSESMQQQNQIEKNLQEAQKIQQTNEKSNTGNVNENGHHGSMYYGRANRRRLLVLCRRFAVLIRRAVAPLCWQAG